MSAATTIRSAIGIAPAARSIRAMSSGGAVVRQSGGGAQTSLRMAVGGGAHAIIGEKVCPLCIATRATQPECFGLRSAITCCGCDMAEQGLGRPWRLP